MMLTGHELLRDPSLNKGSAFTRAERKKFLLEGLLPPGILTLEEQKNRIINNFRNKVDELEKYIFMISLQERNQTLFYRVVSEYIDEMMPILYTPTVGLACQSYSQIFRRPQGLYLPINASDRLDEIIANWPKKNVEVIVVSDGERILGLGDLGINGMGIPVGKLTLYTSIAGIHPNNCLPIMLDVGTNNESLREDPLYLGLKQSRVPQADYNLFLDNFMNLMRKHFPKSLIQFEDFANHNAFQILSKYRNSSLVFNDDIQGTGSVTLAGIISAQKLLAKHFNDLRVLFIGSGEAGLGIGTLLSLALQENGLSKAETQERLWFVDSKGLIVKSRRNLNTDQKLVAKEGPLLTDLNDIVEYIRPTILIGTTGKAGIFSKEIVKSMTKFCPRPIIFALSNPTSNAECTAEQAYIWSGGKAIFSGGSPFSPVEYNRKLLVPSQANNVYIFPGIGLGALTAKVSTIPDSLFISAAKALSAQVTENDFQSGSLFPPLKQIKAVTIKVASAVASEAFTLGIANVTKPKILESTIHKNMYTPEY